MKKIFLNTAIKIDNKKYNELLINEFKLQNER